MTREQLEELARATLEEEKRLQACAAKAASMGYTPPRSSTAPTSLYEVGYGREQQFPTFEDALVWAIENSRPRTIFAARCTLARWRAVAQEYLPHAQAQLARAQALETRIAGAMEGAKE